MIPKTLIEKVPPQNIEAETAVLGSMLIDKNAIALAIERLGENSFYSEDNKKIFRAIVKLYDNNEAIDVVTLIEELKKGDMLDEVGGPAHIMELANSIPTAAEGF